MPRIGTSDLTVFPLALGGNVFGWTADEETSHRVLDAYAGAGGDFVDSADVYSAWAPGNSGGESERVIGSWLRASGKRDDVVIATKVSQHPEYKGLSASTVAAAARASLERLGTDRIDLYYAHFDDESTPLEETVRAFDQLVREGLVRYTAISNYSRARAEEWIRIADENGLAKPVAIQPHYNLVTREPYESEIAPLAAAEHLGVVPYFALAAGFLTGKYRTKEDFAGADREGQVSGYFTDEGLAVVDALDTIADAHGVAIATVSLAWLQAQPDVVAPIASARNTEQLPALLASAELELTPEELQTLTDASAKVPAAR
ncbi:aryl-alcohol dehydrogenase-like predicted oxidoreductase [Curtobacterium luteum]|uniref:Aryl-alcohol dehydrogenase-like predicted oxidoreductase n=1 Tax=Curtobacterium luteum TaxID=33881 RepID=A0A8H9KZG2_9MICO|nr:aldo/keto reductase [Curtobacterium luteum]MBM7803864.1 aryl-alcohol dehydrogenase-like predicted oxidoreductase [Curtobacterium luteum]NUU51414.1 aldo/keto reductase [Curtobacterium luteum]GGL04540.1 NADP-dependent aryl-alcohol dehydrogenase [Curtobacterium luteum]